MGGAGRTDYHAGRFLIPHRLGGLPHIQAPRIFVTTPLDVFIRFKCFSTIKPKNTAKFNINAQIQLPAEIFMGASLHVARRKKTELQSKEADKIRWYNLPDL